MSQVPLVPLLAPLAVARLQIAETRHAGDAVHGYTAHGLCKLVGRAMMQLLAEMKGLSEADRMSLHQSSPRAFRHTFGIHAAAGNVPIDVI
jgi:hypothetical protein